MAPVQLAFRGFATLFPGFGAAHVWCARNPAKRGGVLMAMPVVFFLGGFAGLVSWAKMGPPVALFVILGAMEPVSPPIPCFWLKPAYPPAT